jgi:hypothetical protein
VKIEPIKYFIASHRTDGITGYSKAQIERLLGFPPNFKDDPDKVIYSWRFTIDGKECAIWDYHGSHKLKRWSAYDPHKVLSNFFLLDSRKPFPV